MVTSRKPQSCRHLPESFWGWYCGYLKLPGPSVGGGGMVGGWRGERSRGRKPSAVADSAGNANAENPWEHTAGAVVC